MKRYSVMIKLRANDTTMQDVLILFDTIIEDFSSIDDRLKPDAEIILLSKFESTVTKILSVNECLNIEEQNDVFQFERNDRKDICSSELLFAKSALKRKKAGHSSISKYKDLRFIFIPSNLC